MSEGNLTEPPAPAGASTPVSDAFVLIVVVVSNTGLISSPRSSSDLGYSTANFLCKAESLSIGL